MPTTTNKSAAVARHAERVKQTLRFARSRATATQTDPYTRQLAKDTLSRDRSRCIEQCVALVVDVAQRGSLEDAEAIGLELLAIARAEWGAAHPEERDVQLSVEEAHMLEEHAEGLVEEMETAMAHTPTLTNRLKYLATAAAHTRARRELDAAVRRENLR